MITDEEVVSEVVVDSEEVPEVDIVTKANQMELQLTSLHPSKPANHQEDVEVSLAKEVAEAVVSHPEDVDLDVELPSHRNE